MVSETDLRDGGLADLHSYRLKLWVGGQVQFVVPQQLQDGRSIKHLNYIRLQKLALKDINTKHYFLNIFQEIN